MIKDFIKFVVSSFIAICNWVKAFFVDEKKEEPEPIKENGLSSTAKVIPFIIVYDPEQDPVRDTPSVPSVISASPPLFLWEENKPYKACGKPPKHTPPSETRKLKTGALTC